MHRVRSIVQILIAAALLAACAPAAPAPTAVPPTVTTAPTLTLTAAPTATLNPEPHETEPVGQIVSILGGGEENRALINSFPVMTSTAPENTNYPLLRDSEGKPLTDLVVCDDGSVEAGMCVVGGRVAGAIIIGDGIRILVDVPVPGQPNTYLRVVHRPPIVSSSFLDQYPDKATYTMGETVGDLEANLQRLEDQGWSGETHTSFNALYSIPSEVVTLRSLSDALYDPLISGELDGLFVVIQIRGIEKLTGKQSFVPTKIDNLIKGSFPEENLGLNNTGILYLPQALIEQASVTQ